MSTDTLELSSFFERTEFDVPTFDQYADAAHASFAARERFTVLTNEYQARVDAGQGSALALGLALVILGKYTAALEVLAKAPASAMRYYYAGEAAQGLNRFAEATEQFQQAARHGWDAVEIALRIAAVHVRAGDLTAAAKLVSQHEAAGAARADWFLVRGLLAEAQGERGGALEAYEQALELNPHHVATLFCAARLHDLCGNDTRALDLYHELTDRPRAYVNALMNAAVIYEDQGEFERAALCLRRVLKAYPNQRRARLFLESVEGSRQMMIDEGRDEQIDARARLLATPLSEFELSVRARNCLKKMNVRTLGELIHLTDLELLAYKNFGETSLNEIKALLTRKGLRLGMQPDEVDAQSATQPVAPRPALPPEQEAVLSKPVSELELSVRSRRCLQRLNVQSLGDLIQLSEADLLATRNFGVTSLNEVKARLAEHNLKFAEKSAH